MTKQWKKIFGFMLAFMLTLGVMSGLQMEQALAAMKADVAQIATGDLHTLLLKADGTVWAWGCNNAGQLGDGTTIDKTAPVQVNGLTGVKAIAAESWHSLALKADGTVWAWGYNGHGQLGDGTKSTRTTPVQVNGLTGVKAIATGYNHSLALKEDGTVWAWGSNYAGQLGDKTTIDKTAPVQVNGLTEVKAISSREHHSLAIKEDGTVWAWGDNRSGQLGDGTKTNRTMPLQVNGLTEVKAISGGIWHSLALREDGTTWAWGDNSSGQLGDGTTIDRIKPVQVNELTGVRAISGGDYHSLAIKEDGTVWAWGFNANGELCDGTTIDRITPMQANGLTGVKAISGGQLHNLAIKEDDTVWAWGNNSSGQLGDGTTTNSITPVMIIEPAALQSITGLTCTVKTKTSMTLQWNALSNADEYEILLDSAVARTTTGTSIVIDGLTPGATYKVEVRGKNSESTGPLSQPLMVTAATLISTAADLKNINNDKEGYYILANDIDLNNEPWASIGSYSANAFRGTFDGNGHTIFNVNMSRTDNVGLFGYLENATVQNVTLENIDVTGNQNVGSLIGSMDGSRLINCHVKGTGTVKGAATVGGLVGKCYLTVGQNIIDGCSASVNVECAGGNAGGLVGRSTGIVKNSSASGNVVANGTNTGALIGADQSNANYPAEISNCYATGNVTGTEYIGGLLGADYATTSLIITNCYATGQVTAQANVGGLIGYIQSETRISNCFSLSQITSAGINTGGLTGRLSNGEGLKNSYFAGTINSTNAAYGIAGNTSSGQYASTSYFNSELSGIAAPASQARSTAEMMQKQTFGSWDFSSIWQIDEGKNYPYLRSLPRPDNFVESRIGKDIEITITVDQELTLAMTAEEITDMAGRTFTMTYDPAKLTLMDFAAQTRKPDISPGKVTGTDLEILSMANGVIQFKSTRSAAPGTSFSGALTMVKFKAKTSGKSTLSLYTDSTDAKVASALANPAPGTYTSAQNVTLSCATAGAAIRYTTNGTEPTSASTLYAGPISVATSTTIKAKAFRSGLADSATATFAYTIGIRNENPRTVTGTVFPIFANDSYLGIDVIVELREAFNTPAPSGLSTIVVGNSTDGTDGDGKGTFIIENVPIGTYVLYVYRPGYLERAMMVTVGPYDFDIITLTAPGATEKGVFKLIPGDVNRDGIVDVSDLTYVNATLGSVFGEDRLYSIELDLNADGIIDNSDLSYARAELNTTVLDYPGAEGVDFE